MKLAILIRRYLTTGGAERYAVEVARRLALKHEVHIFAQEFDHVPEGMTIHRVPKRFAKPNFANQWWFSWWTARHVRGFDVVYTHERATRFDVMHIHSGTFVGGLLGKSPDEKKHRFNVLLKLLTQPRVAAYWWLEKLHYRPLPGRRWIAVSDMIKREVQAFYPIPDDRFSIAHPGADLPDATVDAVSQRKFWRHKLSVADDEVLLIFVGSEFKRKGLTALINALALLKSQPVKLVIVGGGDRSAFERQAASLNLTDKLLWAGLVKNTGDYYAAADIFVLPTLSDAGPMSPIEAMAQGCPAIFSGANYAGMAEMIQDDEAILLKDPKSEVEIAAAIVMLLNKDVRRQYASRGRLLAGKLSWERTADLVRQALEAAANRVK